MSEFKNIISMITELSSALEDMNNKIYFSESETKTDKKSDLHKNDIKKIININHGILKKVIFISESVEQALSCVEYAHGIAELVEQSQGSELFHSRQRVVIDALATFTLDSRNTLKSILGYI